MAAIPKHIQRRDMMVNFRVTEEEYSRLQQATTAAGARSVSDYVRTLVVDGSIRMVTIEQRLARVEDRIAAGHAGSAEGDHLA